LRSPRRSTYATVAALLLALTILASLIILASPVLHSVFSILRSSFSILHWPALIPTIGIPLQIEYRQVIAAAVIGLLLLALIGYFVRRRLRDRLARRQESTEAQERRTIQPEALAMAYRHKLLAQLSQLKVLDVANPLDLKTSYVPRRVLFEGNETANSSKMAAAPTAGGETMSPQEALVRFRHLALLGEPGAGKTTLLRHLAFQAAQGKLEDLPDFPIFISLSQFAAAAPQSLLDLIIREIDVLHSSPALRSYLEERLEEGSVLLLLDGLDETSVGARSAEPFSGVYPEQSRRAQDRLETKPQETEATYRHVVGQINVLTARYPKIPVVVTSRRAGWKGLLAASFRTLDVVKLGQDDVQRFIEDWFGWRSDRALELRRTILQTPEVRALAANPLLLSLIALVFEQDGELPQIRGERAGTFASLRTELYERGMEVLLEKWETHRGRKQVSRFTAEHQRDLLEKVALFFHLRRLVCFPEDDLSGITASCLSAVGLPADWVPTALERSSALYGLLREQAPRWYSFSHLTWQEYFAAAAISKGGRLGLMLEGIPDLWWEGTTLFLAGMMEDATPLLEGILHQEDDVFHSNLLLAGRCLACKPRIKQAVLRESIIERLQELVEGKVHPSSLLLRQRAIGVLAEIGDPSIAAYFMSLVRMEKGEWRREKSLDQTVHRCVTTALASLGDQSTVTDLLALLSDQGLDLTVRINVAAALGSLSDKSIKIALVPQLLALLSDEEVDYRVRMAVAEALAALGACPEPSRSHETVTPQLLRLLSDEKIDYRVRVRVAEALAALGACPEPSRRDETITSQLLRLLRKEKVDYNVRMTVAEALGSLGDKSISHRLLAILAKKKIDPDVRASVAAALGPLGDKSVIPQLMRLLPNQKIDYSIRWKIVDALAALGAMDDEATVPDLLDLLANEEIDPSVRVSVAEAMGEKTVTPPLPTPLPIGREAAEALRSLGDRSKAPWLLALLPDRELDRSMRLRIVETLGDLGNDRITAEGLAALLDDEEIGSEVHQALFLVSQRIGMRVFAREGGGYEVR
jgi:HEAT repeat protein